MRFVRGSIYFTMGVLISGLLLLGGCSDENSTAAGGAITAENQTIDLDDPYGGFLAVDEAPAFGDAELAAMGACEERQRDGYAGLSAGSRQTAVELEESDDRDAYSLTILWGCLYDESDSAGVSLGDETLEWPGSLELSDGAIRLLSLINFERWEDHILRDGEPGKIAWESITHGSLDGIRVLVIVPADSSGEVPVQTLSLELGDYTRELSTTELVDLDELIELSETAKISLRAFKVDEGAEVHGFCNGFWGRRPGQKVGTFRGAWVLEDGRLVGFMRGHYGINSQDARVFFGKYIDGYGRFGGFLRGHWDVTETDGVEGEESYSESGTFEGMWVNWRGNAIGSLKGHWGRREGRPGIFNGAWHGHLIVPEVNEP
ncbi:MAG: hypothetical protein KAY32_00660 [Candidatus Eisenbacteria sp.]|nr:hypothetical protein [Candidatus Eisenbacteria bacterium]